MTKRRLTQQQRDRIRSIQDKRRERLTQQADNELNQAKEQHLEGLVVTRHGQNLVVADQEGKLHHCLWRQNIGHVVCGDQVVWQSTGEKTGVVIALLDRTSILARPDYSGREKPLAANITQLVVVLASEPAPSEYLLDQYLVTAETIGVKAVIAFNKVDLLNKDQANALNKRFELYKTIGYPLIRISAKFEHGLDPLIDRLRGETSILVGQSGVGKSSLINALLPDQDIQVGHLSSTSGLGRHTTSASTYYSLPDGGHLIDSPGVRSFRLVKLSRNQLEHGFREFGTILGNCRFNDCRHLKEPGCALQQAVAEGEIAQRRLDNFLHMVAQQG
ncbi:Ribosome small subunit biogenesis RbfA-release protein RsgA [hydrothermal vent metagenome]|uniref:Ribosome small subunit biogenesis RbfA-release protein RsgA n=1 Tax=hydrothermal vent metagenome TaxID=652676 RepID=A0A3B1BZK2_9ZZZZ